MSLLEIYTDGSCMPNPGPGGWACYILDNKKTELYGFEKHATNNKMEMMAAIKALEYIDGYKGGLRIYTDSQYLCKGITTWINGWKRNNWKSRTGPVKNKELWVRLDALNLRHRVEWQWVRGHNGNEYNEKVDGLCGIARQLRITNV